MGELPGQSAEAGIKLEENLTREGLLVVNIDKDSPSIAWLSGKVVVDARYKKSDEYPKGRVNRDEADKFGQLIGAVRTALCSSGFDREVANKILLREGKKTGLKAVEAVVIGEVPPHWKERNHITRHYFKTREDLDRLYPPS